MSLHELLGDAIAWFIGIVLGALASAFMRWAS